MSVLNLKKNDILNLTKHDPGLNRIRLAAGWDKAERYREVKRTRKEGGIFGIGARTVEYLERERINDVQDFDLDLSASIYDEEGNLIDIVYFGSKTRMLTTEVGRMEVMKLHEDNRTGEGNGDDEKISMSLNYLPKNYSRILVGITIYQGRENGQDFGQVKNAYIRLLNEDKRNEEVCRFNLTENGGRNTALAFAELERVNGEWTFKALGDLMQADIRQMSEMYEEKIKLDMYKEKMRRGEN